MQAYVPTHVCVYTYMHAYVLNVCIHVWMNVITAVCNVNAYVCVCIYIYTHMKHASIHATLYVYTHAHTCMHAYIRTYIRTHTHIHAYTWIQTCLQHVCMHAYIHTHTCILYVKFMYACMYVCFLYKNPIWGHEVNKPWSPWRSLAPAEHAPPQMYGLAKYLM